MSEAKFSMRLKYALNKDDIPRRGLLYIRILEMKSVSSGDPAISELVRGFLDPEFLVRPKFGVTREEGQFSINLILNAFLGSALLQRFVAVVYDLHVVLAATDVAGECCHCDFRLDLAGSDHDCFDHYQTSDFI